MGFIAIVEGVVSAQEISSPGILHVRRSRVLRRILHTSPNGRPFIRDNPTVYAPSREAEAAGWAMIRVRGKRSNLGL